MPNAKVLESKQEKVKILAEKLSKSKMTIFTDYRGITVEDDMALRKSLRESGNECVVIKNTIIKLAAKEAKIEGLDAMLEGPTAVILGYDDYVAPAKAAYEYSKTHEFYKLKGGVMDGKMLDQEEVMKLAKLPSRDTLLSMLASALIGNIRNLAVVLDQTAKKKEEAVVA